MALQACACCRIAGCFALIYVCWDIKAVFYAIWSPFTFFVGYNDPRKPTDDLLHGETPLVLVGWHSLWHAQPPRGEPNILK